MLGIIVIKRITPDLVFLRKEVVFFRRLLLLLYNTEKYIFISYKKKEIKIEFLNGLQCRECQFLNFFYVTL